MENENTYLVEFINYAAVIKNETIEDIKNVHNDHSLQNKTLTSEELSEMLTEMINSRIASENVILEYENREAKLVEENETLLDKLKEAETFIEDNRGKLE